MQRAGRREHELFSRKLQDRVATARDRRRAERKGHGVSHERRQTGSVKVKNFCSSRPRL